MRIATITYASSQGIAHLAKWFFDNGVINEVAIFRHGSRTTHREWYPEGTLELVGRPFNGPEVEAFVKRNDVFLFFETPFDWSFLDFCRRRGKKTVIVPMYECYPKRPGHRPDKWICPSLLDVEYFPGSPYIPTPIPTSGPKWQLRTRAKKFLHNGGNLGLREHKGTRQILQAMQYVESPIELTVRAQDDTGLHKIIREVSTTTLERDPRIKFEYGGIPYDQLFVDHDVFIMAEKYNGESLPLKEARSAGMVVMTSDRFPMNTWLPTNTLIPVKGYQRACISGAYNEYNEAIVDPVSIAKTIDEWYDRDVSEYSLSGKEWANRNNWDTLKPVWMKEILETQIYAG
jgi:hypothetical protein